VVCTVIALYLAPPPDDGAASLHHLVGLARAAQWKHCTTEAGLPGFHFHDLRDTGNTLAAGTGASLADLMARMGHGSTRAAMIYQHATQQADQAIATALDEQIHQHQQRARNGHGEEDCAS
jgi:integrase